MGSFGSATIAGGELQILQSGGSRNDQGDGRGDDRSGDDHQHGSGVTQDIAVSGKMTLVGSSAHTEFVGGTGSSDFIGHSGRDTFVGGSGQDTMTGSGKHNVFEFLKSESGGQHVITNFVSGDQLYVEGHSLSYLQAHHDITVSGGNTYISIDGGKTMIELKGFTGLHNSDITTHKP
jgi:Ca2+-binding RTX toxin-like protein